MYTIPWFEENIQANTELHAYLSTTDKLMPTTDPAEFWLAAMTWFPELLNRPIVIICLSVPVIVIAAKLSFCFFYYFASVLIITSYMTIVAVLRLKIYRRTICCKRTQANYRPGLCLTVFTGTIDRN